MPPDSAPALREAQVWVVEDNDLYRETLAGLIEEAEGLRCAFAGASGEEALAVLDAGHVPDIVLMDIGLTGMNGIAATRQIKARVPATRIIMLTVHEENSAIFEAICAGASGYLLKPSPAEHIVEAIQSVQQGAAPINMYIAGKVLDMFSRLAVPAADYGLTAREKETLQLMTEGMTMRQ
ncbi:MAG TPA: response regulator transcription factor, partial [Rhodothermales bacterium]|nr:response regulator transcription factor [Rhodothermales bacterium]